MPSLRCISSVTCSALASFMRHAFDRFEHAVLSPSAHRGTSTRSIHYQGSRCSKQRCRVIIASMCCVCAKVAAGQYLLLVVVAGGLLADLLLQRRVLRLRLVHCSGGGASSRFLLADRLLRLQRRGTEMSAHCKRSQGTTGDCNACQEQADHNAFNLNECLQQQLFCFRATSTRAASGSLCTSQAATESVPVAVQPWQCSGLWKSLWKP